MKAPTGPFWAWVDIGGEGEKWELAHVTPADSIGGAQIHYPLAEFDDHWYDDDWEPEDIKTIRKPAPPTTP